MHIQSLPRTHMSLLHLFCHSSFVLLVCSEGGDSPDLGAVAVTAEAVVAGVAAAARIVLPTVILFFVSVDSLDFPAPNTQISHIW